jgi:hypothetical protein
MNIPAHGWNPDASYGAPANPSLANPPKTPAARVWQTLTAACWRIWAAIESRRATQRRRTLRVVETVAMGEKRFVAILQVEEQRFLVGGGSAGVSLLAKLDAAPDFAAALDPQPADVQSANRIREAW